MKLEITKRVLKDLEKLDAKQFKQVGVAIFRLLKEPEPHDSAPLKGATRGERRIDVGEYRVIYAVHDEMLEVLVFGKRNDDEVYRMWERLQS